MPLFALVRCACNNRMNERLVDSQLYLLLALGGGATAKLLCRVMLTEFMFL